MQPYHITHRCPITSHQMHVLVSRINSYVSLCLVQTRISNTLIIPAWGLTLSIITLSHGAKHTLICNCISLGYVGREHCTCAFAHIIFLILSLYTIKFLQLRIAEKAVVEAKQLGKWEGLGLWPASQHTTKTYKYDIHTWQSSHGVYVGSNVGDVQWVRRSSVFYSASGVIIHQLSCYLDDPETAQQLCCDVYG